MSRSLPALLLALLAALPDARALPPDTWVVAIGNNRGAPTEVGLLYAERDAQQVAEVLRRQGGVPPKNVLVLASEDAQVVRRALRQVNVDIRARSSVAPTALVVFYSGHADALALHLGGGELPFDELKELVGGSPAAMRLLIVDACRSGSVTRVKGMQDAPAFDLSIQQAASIEGLAIVTSSAAGETSQEADHLRGSFFSHHLVNALRGAADSDGDGEITLGEAYAYTYAQTLRSTGQTLALQHPTYAYEVKGKGELVLARTEARGPVGRLRLAEPTTYLVSEGRDGGALVAETTPERQGALLALPAGGYFVQQRLAGEYREFEVTVEPGAEAAIAGRAYRSIQYDRLVRRRGGDAPPVHGLFVLGAGRGEVIGGEGAAPQLQLGYTLDLPWFTVGARVRGGTTTSSGAGGVLPRRHSEAALGLTLQRVVDFEALSVGFGLLAELAYHRQTFTGEREAPPRNVIGGAFGGLLAVERHLGAGGLALHLEGGPVTFLHEQAVVRDGREVGSAFVSPFTWWVAGGVVWRR